ncbi:MAG: pirin family protein [Deltaproteobacteria bacterium]|nr:pirin family protein [Nannocystaceae bacterium]
MITIRRSSDRGHAQHGWLESRHTFSFADYHDPQHMGFRALRVINEDRVQPGKGFGTHAHSDMEIISYVLDGSLEHKDSLGTGSVIRPGDVQRMSAGTGVRHSEYNASKTELVHFLQIWIMPARKGDEPGYEQQHFDDASLRGGLRLVASPDGSEGSVTVHQDVTIRAARLAEGESASHTLAPGRHGWVHVARGKLRLGDHELAAGDAAALSDETEIRLVGVDDAEVLVFDLA